MIPVKDNHALYRDEESNAIISTNMTEYKRYVEARKRKEDEKTELDSLKNDISCNLYLCSWFF
jgi:hypothetical protein